MQYFGISRFADHEDEEIFKLEALLQMHTKDRLQNVSSILQLAGTTLQAIILNICEYNEKAELSLCTCGVFFLQLHLLNVSLKPNSDSHRARRCWRFPPITLRLLQLRTFG